MEERFDSIREMVETDFVNCSDIPEFYYKYYHRQREPHFDESYSFDKWEIEMLPEDIFPEWYFTTEEDDWTQEQQNEYAQCINEAEDEYMSIWNDLVDEYFEEQKDKRNAKLEEWKKNNPERTLELMYQYEDEKSNFEANRNSYYGYCMHGGGGHKAFRSMYGDGNFYSWDEWLADKVL